MFFFILFAEVHCSKIKSYPMEIQPNNSQQLKKQGDIGFSVQNNYRLNQWILDQQIKIEVSFITIFCVFSLQPNKNHYIDFYHSTLL